jgi:peptide/nickel transport system substrate-binding protein
MKKLSLAVSLLLALLLIATAACRKEEVKKPEIKNPDTFVVATIGEAETLDPAWGYDTASAEVILNVYETLISFKGESTSEFEPLLATEWQISADGKEYRFKIRSGVKFHNGNDLTPEDVEYSFQRAMVQDRDGGPVWMLLEPLLGVHSTRDDEGNIAVNFADIDNAVTVDGDWVVFHLKEAYQPFMAILAGSWGAVVDKEWVAEQGGWDGTEATWTQFNNPEVSPIQSKMNGTGPFKLERWDAGVEIVLTRNDNYWRTPAKLAKAVIKVVPEWTTRKLMLTAGDADYAYVPRAYIEELEGAEGITVYKDLPTLSLAAMFFNMNISPNSPYLGSGQLDGNGIPPDFFSDKDVRLGFAYAFDYATYLADALKNEAVQPASPVIEGLPYHNPDQEKYTYNLDKAKEHLQAAWGGQVWEKGFDLTVFYNVGNVERKTAADMLMWSLVRLHPDGKFKVKVQALPWPAYLRDLVARNMPIFFIGWLADYADPHNFVYPFMHSKGDFSGFQGYSNPEVDQLIEDGIKAVDPTQRQSIYYQLQQLYHDEVISIPLHQPLGRRYQRDWVKGWYYNPIFPANTLHYFYALSKEY